MVKSVIWDVSVRIVTWKDLKDKKINFQKKGRKQTKKKKLLGTVSFFQSVGLFIQIFLYELFANFDFVLANVAERAVHKVRDSRSTIQFMTVFVDIAVFHYGLHPIEHSVSHPFF